MSLADANLFLLKKIGIPDGNVFVSKECTCCFKENGAFKYGSFRRQTSSLPQDLPLEEKQKQAEDMEYLKIIRSNGVSAEELQLMIDISKEEQKKILETREKEQTENEEIS